MNKEKNYLVYEGLLRWEMDPFLTTKNRAFRYGDGLFETIRFHKGEPLFWENHYRRLMQGMAVLKISGKGFPGKNDLKASIKNLVVKNRLFYDSRIRVTVFRKDGGLYTPENSCASWIIEASDIGSTGYSFPEKGILTGIYTEFPKLASPSSPYKTIGSTPYILAGIYCKEKNLDDCLMTNGNGKIIESLSSNLFWYRDSILYTPMVSTGCIEGIFRQQILKAAKECNIKIIQNQGSTEKELLEAEEIFLTNSITGIRWISGLKERRYYASVAKQLYKIINEKIKSNAN